MEIEREREAPYGWEKRIPKIALPPPVHCLSLSLNELNPVNGCYPFCDGNLFGNKLLREIIDWFHETLLFYFIFFFADTLFHFLLKKGLVLSSCN